MFSNLILYLLFIKNRRFNYRYYTRYFVQMTYNRRIINTRRFRGAFLILQEKL